MKNGPHLRYRTKYTRDQMDGKKNPERDMTNRKAPKRKKRPIIEATLPYDRGEAIRKAFAS
jgi:hypothetical protein